MNRRALTALASTGLAPLLASYVVAADGKDLAIDAGNEVSPDRMSSQAWLKAAFEPGGFIVAYYLRDPEDKDGHPQYPGAGPGGSGPMAGRTAG